MTYRSREQLLAMAIKAAAFIEELAAVCLKHDSSFCFYNPEEMNYVDKAGSTFFNVIELYDGWFLLAKDGRWFIKRYHDPVEMIDIGMTATLGNNGEYLQSRTPAQP